MMNDNEPEASVPVQESEKSSSKEHKKKVRMHLIQILDDWKNLLYRNQRRKMGKRKSRRKVQRKIMKTRYPLKIWLVIF